MVIFSALLLMTANPYLFGGSKDLHLIFIGIYTIFYPLIGVLLLRGTGFIDSFGIPEKKQRIAPYILTSVFYLWFFVNVKGNPDFPSELSMIVLGGCIAIFLCFFVNIFDKISAHAAGVAGLLMNSILIFWLFSDGHLLVKLNKADYWEISMIYAILIITLIAGLVSTARMALKSHNIHQIIGGWFVGLLSPIIALKLMNYVS